MQRNELMKYRINWDNAIIFRGIPKIIMWKNDDNAYLIEPQTKEEERALLRLINRIYEIADDEGVFDIDASKMSTLEKELFEELLEHKVWVKVGEKNDA